MKDNENITRNQTFHNLLYLHEFRQSIEGKKGNICCAVENKTERMLEVVES